MNVNVIYRPGQKKLGEEDDLPAEYLASPLSQQSQVRIYERNVSDRKLTLKRNLKKNGNVRVLPGKFTKY